MPTPDGGPSIRDVLLPLLGGVVAAASPAAGRATIAASNIADRTAARRAQASQKAQEEAKRASLSEALSGLQLGDNPADQALRAMVNADPVGSSRLVYQRLADQARRAAKVPEPETPILSTEQWPAFLENVPKNQSVSARVRTPDGAIVNVSGKGTLAPPGPTQEQEAAAAANQQGLEFVHSVADPGTPLGQALHIMYQQDPEKAIGMAFNLVKPKPEKEAQAPVDPIQEQAKAAGKLRTELGRVNKLLQNVDGEVQKQMSAGRNRLLASGHDVNRATIEQMVDPGLLNQQRRLRQQKFDLQGKVSAIARDSASWRPEVAPGIPVDTLDLRGGGLPSAAPGAASRSTPRQSGGPSRGAGNGLNLAQKYAGR